MSSYTFYWREGSGSLVVDVALALCGATVERSHVNTRAGAHLQPEFLAVNPAAQIPVLTLPDGTVLTESAAILVVLSESFPDAGLLPPVGTPARAMALRWLMLLATTGYSASLRAYHSNRYTTDTSPDAIEAVRSAANAELGKIFGIIAQAAPGPFLAGERMTIVDVYLVMLADWYEPALELPAIRAIRDRVLSDPLVAEAWSRHEQGV